jgi:hypothetical protein
MSTNLAEIMLFSITERFWTGNESALAGITFPELNRLPGLLLDSTMSPAHRAAESFIQVVVNPDSPLQRLCRMSSAVVKTGTKLSESRS